MAERLVWKYSKKAGSLDMVRADKNGMSHLSASQTALELYKAEIGSPMRSK